VTGRAERHATPPQDESAERAGNRRRQPQADSCSANPPGMEAEHRRKAEEFISGGHREELSILAALRMNSSALRRCAAPIQEDANKNRLAAAAVGFRAIPPIRPGEASHGAQLGPSRRHVCDSIEPPRMAVNNCSRARPLYCRLVRAFGMASLIFFLDIKPASSQIEAARGNPARLRRACWPPAGDSDQSSPGKTSDISWSFCTGRFSTFRCKLRNIHAHTPDGERAPLQRLEH